MGLLDNQSQNAYYTGSEFGTYQFTSMDNIISAFMVTHVGESKILSKVDRSEVQFHAIIIRCVSFYKISRNRNTTIFNNATTSRLR